MNKYSGSWFLALFERSTDQAIDQSMMSRHRDASLILAFTRRLWRIGLEELYPVTAAQLLPIYTGFLVSSH
jgi:hypothetical protein